MRKTLVMAALVLAPALALAQPYGGGWGPGYGPGGGRGPGMGMGMMRGGGLAALDLSEAQAEKIFAIQDEMRQKNWPVMRKMRSEMFKLNRLYNDEKADAAAVTEQQKKVDELRREMLKSHLEARKRVEAVLTPEQRKQLRQRGPWWLGEDDGG